MYIKTIKEVLVLIKKQIRLLPIASLFDLLFFFFYGFIGAFILRSISPFVDSIVSTSSKFSADINFLNDPFKYLLKNQEFMSNIYAIGKYFIIFALAFYLLWIFFQGSVWFMANKISNIKIKFSDYISKFAVLSIFWLALITISTSAFSIFAFKSLVTLQRTIDESTILLFSSISDFIIFYFVIISLALVSRLNFIENLKKTFKIGILRIHKIIPSYIIIISAFLILNLLMILISKINTSLSIFIEMLTAMPLLTLSRIYLMKIIEKVN